MISNAFIDVPTYRDGQWTKTIFKHREAYVEFVKDRFKEPGQYDFDETSFVFNEQAQIFRQQEDVYCMAPYRSKDFIEYWEGEKEKCRKGAIFVNEGKTWYLPRDYYMWLNFLPIYDKAKGYFDFPKIYDTQYHLALYELLAELHYKHSALLKKRQIASSYFHMAKFVNQLWFEEGVVLKIGASESRHIDENGSWAFLDEYKDFLNAHTAWYRPMSPDSIKNWQQKIEVTTGGRKRNVGLKGRLMGLSFEQSPTKGVGGACTYFFYEEAGIAPTMDKTVEYIRPAMRDGELTTGMFIAAGSVGDLKDCEPLKKLTLNPEDHDIYAVETNLIDANGTWGKSGLFIPEQWSMPPHMDEFGNSRVDQALKSLDAQFEKWKKTLDPETYQLRISQHPRNIEEAFAYREESKFPQHLVAAQQRRIEEKEYPYELIELSETAEGRIKAKRTLKVPISDFPVNKKMEDKSGSIVVWERPDKDAEWGTYYISIDPVSEGKTVTSDSLCSIYVYKNPVEVTRVTLNETENFIEGDKIVAAWCGRFDDINETHNRLRLIIEWYNGWTLIENNISLFIQYMIAERKQKYLVPKNQIVFLKDLQANKTVFADYGWRNTGKLFSSHLLSYLIEWLKEVTLEETDEDGTITKKHYGIERIPDPMAMQEMKEHRDGVNVDRLVALASLIAFAKVQQANRGYKKRLETDEHKDLEKSSDLYKLKSGPFRHVGGKNGRTSTRPKRNPFKNMR